MEFSESFFKFVDQFSNADTDGLRLKFSGSKASKLDFPLDLALIQIEARRKTRKKLPSFLSEKHFIFPSLISAEQASNEAVAAYHAALLSEDSSLLDLTGGLGIDDYSFARRGMNVTSCEIDEMKCIALRHNSDVLGLSDKVRVIHTDSIQFLTETKQQYDVIFADPARRDKCGGKVHALEACQPDILSAMSEIMRLSPRLLVKTSPLLDLSHIASTVENLASVHVVCFRGECKEILMEIVRMPGFMREDGIPDIPIRFIDLDWNRIISEFTVSSSELGGNTSSMASLDKTVGSYKFLYEPNAGIMKSGAWNAIVSAFPRLEKADINTHLFLSDYFYEAFPGRILRILSEADKKELKLMKGKILNIVSRNHPLTAPQISTRYHIVAGGEDFLYAFKFRNKPVFLKASLLHSQIEND